VRETSRIQFLMAAQLAEELRNGALILDTRPAEQFATFHIRGSIQISLLGHFAAWSALLIDPQERVAVVAENDGSAREALDRLARVGFHRLAGFTIANDTRWRDQKLDLASIPVQRTQNIQGNRKRDVTLQLIDVRSRAEWLKGHLPGAISLPLLDIQPNARNMDLSMQSLIYCYEGFRATTAASMLLRNGGARVAILVDGVEGWLASGLPLEIPETR
jgi:rhodanese-related sulfurtransferase